jgi:hypothetical protein
MDFKNSKTINIKNIRRVGRHQREVIRFVYRRRTDNAMDKRKRKDDHICFINIFNMIRRHNFYLVKTKTL